MKGYLLKTKKTIASILAIVYMFDPSSFVFSAELNSTNYSIQEYNFGAGNEMNSTNFSITGNLDQTHTGLFSVSNLPLIPGTITSCGKITTSGTYTLGTNLTGISGSCFYIQADNVTIDGNGYSVIAGVSNTSYAIVATSTGSGASAYGTTTIQDITFSGFAAGINASGNNATSGNTNGGNGGAVVIENSSLGAILTSAGLGSGTGSVGNGAIVSIINSITGNITNSGLGGSISISDDNLDISNKIYTTSGTFSIAYTGTLTTTNVIIPAVSNFIVHGINYGSYIGGAFPIIPGTITSCGTLYFLGTYTLGSDITGNCIIAKAGVIIDGDSHTLTGNISAGIHGVTLSNINITGTVSTTGAGAGALIINDISNLTGAISVTGLLSGDGSSSLGNTTISAGASVATGSVSFVSDVNNAGTIGANNAVAGKVINTGTINTGGGTFIFNASSTNSGTVHGSAILSASSTNSGTITGDATFMGLTSSAGYITFSGTTNFFGTGYINGTVFDSINEQIIGWVFNDSSTNAGILKGNAVFNDLSKNATSSILIGNAEFRGTSLNQGTVTGNSDVYSPVVRPLGGITNGQVIYHDYAGLYYHDTVPSSGVLGKWDDINNWWLDPNATIRSPVLPTAGDSVIILSGTLTTTVSPASVYTATFQGTTTNAITITVNSTARDAALFNASSTNNGTIIGNATFAGIGSTNNGTVTGYITRQYSTGIFTVIEDFTHNGINWIVQAVNGATVNLSSATYSLVTNIFEALGNSIFIFNNLIGGGTPDLNITSPTVGTNIKWRPIIDWDTNTLCQYKFDSNTYASVNCSLDGSDIPKPTAGAHTLSLRSTDAQGNVTEKTIVFTYDNTQPIDTDCSTPLDEATRPYYYLTSNVGSCSITASTTLRGDDGLGNYYTVTNVVGSNTNIALQNTTITGNVSGFNTIYVASSTLAGSLTINGNFTTDTISRFASTTITNSGLITGGIFTSTLVNNGIINTSTSTPVTVAGSMTNNGIINGDFVLNASSTNFGTIYGDVILNDLSVNKGTINGTLTFNTLTADSNIVTFGDDTVFQGTGTTTGVIYDNQNQPINIWYFTDNSTNLHSTQGTVFFDDSSTNLGVVKGDAYFDDSSTNNGLIIGNAHRYKAWLIAHELDGAVTGTITYYSYPNSVSFRNISGDNNWNNLSNWFKFATTTIPLGRLPIEEEDIVLFASTTLKSNLTNDIYVAVSTTTINGAYYTLNGHVHGNGAYGGFPAYDFNLEYITVTGSSTAIGGDGNPSIDGGRGGNISVRYSTTGVIVVNGGDPLHNGGDAGTIQVLNSIGIWTETPIKAVGGDSVGCGFGGSGGNVTLIDSAQYIVYVEPGRSATTTIAEGGGCANPPVGNGGSRGQTVSIGRFNPTLNQNPNLSPNQNQSDSSTNSTGVSSKIQDVADWFLPDVKFNIKIPDLNLMLIPTFGGDNKNSFSFIDKIKNFLFAPVFTQMQEKFSSTPNLLENLNIRSMQDLLDLYNSPLILKDTHIPGLFTIYSTHNTRPLRTSLYFVHGNSLAQVVRARPGQELTILLTPHMNIFDYKAQFDNSDVYFNQNKLTLYAPNQAGTYILYTSMTPIELHIEVIDNKFNQPQYINFIFVLIEKIVYFVKNLLSFVLF